MSDSSEDTYEEGELGNCKDLPNKSMLNGSAIPRLSITPQNKKYFKFPNSAR